MEGEKPTYLVYAVQGALLLAAILGVFFGRWSLVFVGLFALALTFAPIYFARWMKVRLPNSFLSAIAFFIFATVFLGEAFDFYERYWWWDILLHFGSAVSFGLVGFLFIFMLFEGDRYAAPPLAIAFLSFCVAVSIGAMWEVFEFGMDQIFGLNMQKSGLVDTMFDMILDAAGGLIGATAGFLYLQGQRFGGLVAAIEEFISLNRRRFRKLRRK